MSNSLLLYRVSLFVTILIAMVGISNAHRNSFAFIEPGQKFLDMASVTKSQSTIAQMIEDTQTANAGGNGYGVIQSFTTVAETSVTLSAGALSIIDNNGGTSVDTITLACNGSNLRISDTGRTISGEAGMTIVDANTVDVPIASVTSILIETLAGNDTVNLNFSGGCDFVPSGGITFDGGDPSSGPGDRLNIVGGSQGTVTYNYTYANSGNIVMTGGNVAGTVNYTGLEPISNTGSATDVVLNLPSGGSNATLSGTGGGNISTLSSAPIAFEITTFTTPIGSVTVNPGNAADTMTVGELLNAYPSLNIGSAGNPFGSISFVDENVYGSGKSLFGYAAGTVSALLDADIRTLGTGTISLTTARDIIVGPGRSLVTVDGALTLAANPAGTTTGAFTGININGGSVSSSGSGKVTVTGKGGNSGTGQLGVALRAGGSINGGNGSGVKTEVNGTGATNNAGDAHGVFVDDASSITSQGGDVLVTGTGGAGSVGGGTDNYGVMVFGTNGRITSGGSGAVSVYGYGGSAVAENFGVFASTGGTITSGGSGDVTVNGTGGLGVFGVGIEIFRGATITSGGGAVNVTGTSPASDAILMVTDVGFSLISSGGGPVTVTGIPGPTAAGILLIQGNAGQTRISSGANAPVTVISDSMVLDFGNTAIDAGTGTVSIRPFTNARGIDLGGPGSASLLGLTDAELDRVTGSVINIGNGATGPVTFTAPITRSAAAVLNVSNGSGNIVVAAGSLATGDGNATFTPGGAVSASHAGVDVTTGATSTFKIASGRTLALTIAGTTADSSYDQLRVLGGVDVTGVNLSLNPGFMPTSGNTFVVVNNDEDDAIIGEFAGLPDEFIITNFFNSGFNAKIDYQGGDGNDCVVTVLPNAPVFYSISGRVVNVNGRGIRGARITVSGGSLPVPLVTLSGPNGFYSIADVPAGGTYTVRAAQRRFTFAPATIVITPTSNVTGADFIGSQ